MVLELLKTDSIANHFLAELRDTKIQSDGLRFRYNLERLGGVMAYELSKFLVYKESSVNTPLGKKEVKLLEEYPVLVTILRAGLSFHSGFMRFFDHSDSGFIGVYRTEGDNDDIRIEGDYVATGNIENKQIVIIDPMLATGKSLINAIGKLKKNGTPAHIHIVSAIAAPEGIEYIKKKLNVDFTIRVGAIDDRLDENAYIVPGLGDAGDLCFGRKL